MMYGERLSVNIGLIVAFNLYLVGEVFEARSSPNAHVKIYWMRIISIYAHVQAPSLENTVRIIRRVPLITLTVISQGIMESKCSLARKVGRIRNLCWGCFNDSYGSRNPCTRISDTRG